MKKLLPILVLVLIMAGVDSLHAQWVRTNPAYGGNILSIVVSGAYLFAGTGGSGVFISTNSGASWTQVDTGLTNSTVNALAASGPDIFAGTDGSGVFLSTNNGTELVSDQLWFNGSLYLGSCCHPALIFLPGLTAEASFFPPIVVQAGLKSTPGLTNNNVNAFAVSNPYLFAGTDGGVFLSTNSGTSWSSG